MSVNARLLAERFKLSRPGARSEFYPCCPKDLTANLQFRKAILECTKDSTDLQEEIWRICSRDILFFVNFACYGYDPRVAGGANSHPISPFITRPYQDDTFLALEDSIGVSDLGINKTRDMGATFMCLLAYLHQFTFREYRTFLCVSRKEELVDKKGDPDSLFWKLDLEIAHLPKWLRPEVDRSSLSIRNPEMNTTIDGTSTVENVGRGGRRTSIFLDEFAVVQNGYAMDSATFANTPSRLFVSTPAGTGNAFADMVEKGKIRFLSLHWTLDQEKSKGLYKGPDGKPRSIWYDQQCERMIHPKLIGQELDMDFLGSVFAWFDAEQIEKCINEDGQPPSFVGELDYDLATIQPAGFIANSRGHWNLWTPIGPEGFPPKDRHYAVAADIAQGTGNTNSVIVVADRDLGVKVAEYADPRIKPEDLARLFVATCRVFAGLDNEGAFGIWEANGPGMPFGIKVVSLGYRHFYMRTSERKLTKEVTDIPGWWSSEDSKQTLFGEYRAALGKSYINRSILALKECREIVFFPGGGIGHSKQSNLIDPSGAAENHADRATADALLCKAITLRAVERTKTEREAPENSIGGRRAKREAEREKANTY